MALLCTFVIKLNLRVFSKYFCGFSTGDEFTFEAKLLFLVGAEEDQGEEDKDDQQRDHHSDHRRHRHRI